MKKVVRASVLDPEISRIQDYMTYTLAGQRFGVHILSDDPLYPKFQVSEIHPYDDADYAWARCGYKGAAYIEFIKSGKKIDGIQWHCYEDEDYEHEWEYLDEIVDQTCRELRHINKDVEPRIIHN